MSRSANSGLLALALLAAAAVPVAPAQARELSVTRNSARGIGTYDRSASCANGTCARSSTATGAYGRSVSRQGSVTRSSPGNVSSSRSVTGPNGQTVNRTGSTSCANGSCSHTGTVSR